MRLEEELAFVVAVVGRGISSARRSCGECRSLLLNTEYGVVFSLGEARANLMLARPMRCDMISTASHALCFPCRTV